jgi:hypothetical protein
MHTFLVNVRTPSGRYVSLTIAAFCAADAGAAAVEMCGGGDVNWVRQLD